MKTPSIVDLNFYEELLFSNFLEMMNFLNFDFFMFYYKSERIPEG